MLYTLVCTCTWALPFVLFAFVILAYSVFGSPCTTKPYHVPCLQRAPPKSYYYSDEAVDCLMSDTVPLGCLPWTGLDPVPPKDMAECVRLCHRPMLDRGCHLVWNVRPCEVEDMKPKFYFNKTLKTCVRSVPQGSQWYTLVGMSGYLTLAQCKADCPDGKVSADPQDPCNAMVQLQDMSPLDRIRSAFFNPYLRLCTSFDAKSLCVGGENQFANHTECSQVCLARPEDNP